MKAFNIHKRAKTGNSFFQNHNKQIFSSSLSSNILFTTGAKNPLLEKATTFDVEIKVY